MSKNQLLSKLDAAARINRKSSSAAFSSMCILCNYVLYRTEQFRMKSLTEYNERTNRLYRLMDEEPGTLDRLYRKLKDKTGWSIDVVYYGEDDLKGIKWKPGTVSHQLEVRRMNAEDEINRISQKYLLSHFGALMEMGFGKMRLERVKNALESRLEEIRSDSGYDAMQMRQFLIDKTGLVIEMPE